MSTSSGIYSSEYGDIPILNADNYSEWLAACELALVCARGLDLVLGREAPVLPLEGAEPDSAQELLWESYMDRRGAVLGILNSSVGANYKHIILRHIATFDLPRIWTDLRDAASRLDDQVYIYKVRQAFNAETFSPPNQTIHNFIERLREFANKVRDTGHPLSDADIREKLFHSLPTNNLWTDAMIHCLVNKLSLERSIGHLSTLESILPIKNTNTANDSRGRRRGKFRGRGRENYRNERSRGGRGRGGGHNGWRNRGASSNE